MQREFNNPDIRELQAEVKRACQPTHGLSALGAGLYSIGIPKNSVLKYETSLKAGKFILIVHGTADEVTRAKEILTSHGASEANVHMADAAVLV